MPRIVPLAAATTVLAVSTALAQNQPGMTARLVPPSGLTVVDAGSGLVMVTWTDRSENETSYKLERNPVFPGGVVTLNANSEAYFDASGNGNFFYRVRCANATGTSMPTAWIPVSVTSGALDPGWTNLTPPAGAQVFHVAADGSDSNPGTQKAPFRTIERGMEALRDGHPDQVLLRCGDTFTIDDQINLTKGSGSTSSYMVVGSYGAGPRPKIRTPGPGFYSPQSASVRTGIAIVGLDIAHIDGQVGGGGAGILFFEPWDHVLIEDCLIADYGVNIVIQAIEEFSPVHLNDVKLRRNVIVDSNNTAEGHSQGIYIACTDHWLIEGNVFDRNGYAEMTMFCHNVYIHESNGAGSFNGNISCRASSHGVQQRPGGIMVNNLFLANPINAFQGNSAHVPNTFKWNVGFDSADINSEDRRGQAFELSDNSVVEYNVAAYNQHGTGDGACIGFAFDGISGTIRNNYVYDWGRPGTCGGAAFQWGSGEGGGGEILVEGNRLHQPSLGILSNHEGRHLSGQFTYRNNTYYTSTPSGGGCDGYAQFSTGGGHGVDWDTWRTLAGESGTTMLSAAPADPNVRISNFMTAIGGGAPTLENFLAQARLQSRQNWRPQYTAAAVNNWVRARVGLPLYDGASPPPICYANCDGSMAPVLSAIDLQCFIDRFTFGTSYANCDGSTSPPVLTMLDFQCFLQRFQSGCP